MSDSFHPYAALYANPSGPGDHRPTALQIVEDANAKGSWTGRVVLITGGTAGIGVETARAMHSTGADVYFTARSLEKAAATRAAILETSPGKGKLEYVEMDMDSLDSVRKAAGEFLSRSSTLNVLINNAGIMAPPYTKTTDGFERQFAVNHLAHYLLTRLLLPALLAGSSPTFNSRVVNVSSSGHSMSPVLFDAYNPDAPSYNPWASYGQSKTANVWTANYVDRTLGPRGVHAVSLHPGGIWTGLMDFTPAEMTDAWKADEGMSVQMMSPAQGAATSVWAAVADVWEGKGGKYLSNCGVAGAAAEGASVLSTGASKHTYDQEGEDKLWALSAKLVGVDVDVEA